MTLKFQFRNRVPIVNLCWELNFFFILRAVHQHRTQTFMNRGSPHNIKLIDLNTISWKLSKILPAVKQIQGVVPPCFKRKLLYHFLRRSAIHTPLDQMQQQEDKTEEIPGESRAPTHWNSVYESLSKRFTRSGRHRPRCSLK